MTTTLEHRDFTLLTRDGPVQVHGVLLGEGTSRAEVHNHVDDAAQPGQKCKACRWSEVKIIRLVETERELSLRTHPSRTGTVAESARLRTEGPRLGDYLIHTAGVSVVDGELTKTRVVRTDDPAAAIRALVVRKYERGELVDVFVTRPAQDALDDAADRDTALGRAFDEWLEDPENERLAV